MKPDDVANAITQALVQGGSQWMVSTIVAFLPALWTMTLMLHLGRPYVLRTLRRCGLRLGADILSLLNSSCDQVDVNDKIACEAVLDATYCLVD